MFASAAAISASLTLACGDPVGPPDGRITVAVSTDGGAFDLDGFSLLLDGDSVGVVDVNAQVTVVADKGAHWVALGGLAPNCFSGSPSQVTLGADAHPRVEVQAFCIAAPELRAVRILFEGRSGLFAMNADGTDVVQLVSGDGLHQPDVSGDGARLAFTRDTQVGADLWIANADGSGQAKLATGSVEGPRWSPDGSEIVYANYGPDAIDYQVGESSGIQVTTSDGENTSVVAAVYAFDFDEWFRWPTWSPDGSIIAFDSNGSTIQTVTRDGSNGFVTVGTRPVWAADDRIAFIGTGASGPQDIKVIHPDGTGATTVFPTGRGTYAHPRDWSSDGALLLYTDLNPSWGTDIYLLDVEAGTVVRVTGDGVSRSPVFWPSQAAASSPR